MLARGSDSFTCCPPTHELPLLPSRRASPRPLAGTHCAYHGWLQPMMLLYRCKCCLYVGKCTVKCAVMWSSEMWRRVEFWREAGVWRCHGNDLVIYLTATILLKSQTFRPFRGWFVFRPIHLRPALPTRKHRQRQQPSWRNRNRK